MSSPRKVSKSIPSTPRWLRLRRQALVPGIHIDSSMYESIAPDFLLTYIAAPFAGLEQLCSIETRFEPFQKTLFSQAGLELSRDERTKADNQTLNASLGAYLRLLTDHFLSVAAFQTLEYLIRRYR